MMVKAVDSMLRGPHERKLEASDFTARLTLGRSLSLRRLRRSLSRGIKLLSLGEAWETLQGRGGIWSCQNNPENPGISRKSRSCA